ncbi:TPA: hypothetical protein N0F65_005445 [Lagenidium giganteum]|uniref:Uncharacterized protein n=1 Tax=Lagenidium giganteum TaxID=4803 RepID=A0AAV2YW27_9STRA|nr:TPA: hypothetical protein N0F65_005445 [Lagenidium giganteum]
MREKRGSRWPLECITFVDATHAIIHVSIWKRYKKLSSANSQDYRTYRRQPSAACCGLICNCSRVFAHAELTGVHRQRSEEA